MFKVYIKELLELTRDKKTLIFTVLLPTLIMPIILIGFAAMVGKITKKAVEESLDYAVIGEANYKELVTKLTSNEKFNRKEISDLESAKEMINKGEVRFVIEIPDDTSERISEGLKARINIYYNDSASTSAFMFRRVNKTIEPLETELLEKRLAELGISKEQGDAIKNPIELSKKSTADNRESIGEVIGAFLPYILILIGLQGAMFPALDLGVGEKERGTLETLLLTPVPRFQLVFAKFLVIFSTSFIAIFLTLISFGLIAGIFGKLVLEKFIPPSGSAKISGLLESLSSISMTDVGLMFLMLIPIAAIFASVLLSISIYARTFKEAQNYMSPFMILVFLPLLLPMLPGVKLDWTWAAVPITNVSLAIKEIFKGTIDMSMLGVIFISTTIIAGALLALCNWWFQREQVLFRN
ncbi:ABC transporter permease [Aliikangiella sp. IMCC44359]|uniref:ABC transporter permease n=1 Tax=Aliikangiella sp. IMCC44359 TaxID=3459125 RepID=UPI00403B2A02